MQGCCVYRLRYCREMEDFERGEVVKDEDEDIEVKGSHRGTESMFGTWQKKMFWLPSEWLLEVECIYIGKVRRSASHTERCATAIRQPQVHDDATTTRLIVKYAKKSIYIWRCNVTVLPDQRHVTAWLTQQDERSV